MNEEPIKNATTIADADRPREHMAEPNGPQSAGIGIILARVVYYIAGVIIAFLLMRVILLLLGANQGSPFVDFVYGVSAMFAWPFYGIFSYQPSYGHFTFEISTIMAVIVYGLIAIGIAKLCMLANNPPVA